jgi:ABC-type xylose transport system permease subunit
MIDRAQLRAEIEAHVCQVAEQGRRETRRDVTWIAAVLLVAAAGGFAYGWWMGRRPVPPMVVTLTTPG